MFSSIPISSQYEATLTFNYSEYGTRTYYAMRFIAPPNFDTTIYHVTVDRFSYLNLNPGIRYYTGNTAKIKPFVGFGLFVGYLLNSRALSYTPEGKLLGRSTRTKVYSRGNYGVTVELGLKAFIGKRQKAFLAAVSYEPGLLNTGKGYINNKSIKDFRTNAINLSFSYQVN